MRNLLQYIDVENLVRDELVESLDLNMAVESDEGGHDLDVDTELIKALILVIEYYTSRHDFSNIIMERKAQLKELGIEVK